MSTSVSTRPTPGISAQRCEQNIIATDRAVRSAPASAPSPTQIGYAQTDGRTSSFFNAETGQTELRPTVAKLVKADSNVGQLLGAGSVFFGGDKIGELEVLQPHTKLVSTLNWTKGIFGLSITNTRYGKYTQRTAAGDDRYFGAKIITDASISAKVTDFATLSVGAINLFDVRPEKNGPGNPQTGQGYYGRSPVNPAGGYYYGRIALAF
ncbi:TonB-dependent receptor [Sphingobium lactosutens]|uniref:TonB-dependent receptor n=1 Tax=Sphingobium lactosutens TaxID=522773 RepID=UPI0015C14916|nr:TonB-dependent receptor [Sphingobium lactosutens]